MKIAEAIASFKDSWDRTIGPRSSFSEELTPEGRHVRRLLEDAPPEAVRVLLEGVSSESGGAARPSAQTPFSTKGRRCAGDAASRFRRGAFALALTALVFCGASPRLAPKIGVGATCFLCAALTGAAVAAALAKRNWGADHSGPPNPPAATAHGATIAVDPKSLDKAVGIFAAALGDVVAYAKEKEDDAALGFDITESKSFGDWVQKFVDDVNGDAGNDDFAMLKDELVSKLRAMGITVCDRIGRGKSGKSALPPRDAFRDSRGGGADDFSRVVHAAVYSRRGVLAIGELS